MSYDIYIYHRDVKKLAEAHESLDEFEHPAFDTSDLERPAS